MGPYVRTVEGFQISVDLSSESSLSCSIDIDGAHVFSNVELG